MINKNSSLRLSDEEAKKKEKEYYHDLIDDLDDYILCLVYRDLTGDSEKFQEISSIMAQLHDMVDGEY